MLLLQTGDDLERSFVFTPAKSASASTLALTSPGAGLSLYESMRTSGAASFMENLQSQLKMKDGEIAQLQVYALLALQFSIEQLQVLYLNSYIKLNALKKIKFKFHLQYFFPYRY